MSWLLAVWIRPLKYGYHNSHCGVEEMDAGRNLAVNRVTSPHVTVQAGLALCGRAAMEIWFTLRSWPSECRQSTFLSILTDMRVVTCSGALHDILSNSRARYVSCFFFAYFTYHNPSFHRDCSSPIFLIRYFRAHSYHPVILMMIYWLIVKR